ncbi:plant/protein [Rhynchospora pubera]|uniref:Plant/protein n=1 Tax=Rhynchospora pubera TaxID=906938 RepID=A0AAV8GPA1_9POAL|nr:plant/protein [Rhynchospora pubera]
MSPHNKITPVGPPIMLDSSVLSSSFSDKCNVAKVLGSANNQTDPICTEPVKGQNKHYLPTYLSTGNPCLDYFFHVVPDTPAETVAARLACAWAHDPLTALKLVCNLRGIRGTGKADREGFYASAIWLHENHPKTLALNLPSFAKFGYLKDLLEILYRILNGPDFRPKSSLPGRFRNNPYSEEDQEARRKRKRAEATSLALSRYTTDDQYQFLHDRIAEFFAELLAADMELLNSGKLNKVGLAAKWCPSLDSSFDRATLICESIARKMFPHADPEYETLSDEHYAYHVRLRLRKEVLNPLRKALNLPETHMSSGTWDSLDYSHVASLAMMRYKDIFLKHDWARASEFLDEAGTGGVKVPVGALLPHEILKNAFKSEEDELEDVQWAALVSDMAKLGKFKSCIAMCSNQSMMCKTEVSGALSLLISELSEQPWKGRVVTFGQKQRWHKIDGSSVKEKIKFVRDDDLHGWQGPNILAVFDEILRVATEGKLPPEKMVKRVFIFSDMEFSRDSRGPNSMTDYEVICKKFEENGYGSVMPEIVFWNLSSSKSTPVLAKQKGVALLSGCSKNLLKLFLEMDGEIIPEKVMTAAISGDEYQNLVVFD